MDDNILKAPLKNKLTADPQRARSSTVLESPPESWQNVRKEFGRTAGRVFSRNSNIKRLHLAETEAQMLWLAWRGSDEYLFRHFGNMGGLELSWQICYFKDISRILCASQTREEFRPLTEEFSEPVLASLINQINNFCREGKGQGSDIHGSLAISNNPDIFVEKVSESAILDRKETEILSAMSLIQEGYTLFIRWSMKEAKVLFPRAIELSLQRLVLQNNPKLTSLREHSDNPSLTATRGYLRFVRQKDRLEGQRKRRLGVLRWLSTQRE